MADSTTKFSIPLLGLLYNIFKKSKETVSDIANDSIIKPTKSVVEASVRLAEDSIENIEVLFHREKTFGFVFLLLVVIIILGYKLKK